MEFDFTPEFNHINLDRMSLDSIKQNTYNSSKSLDELNLEIKAIQNELNDFKDKVNKSSKISTRLSIFAIIISIISLALNFYAVFFK